MLLYTNIPTILLLIFGKKQHILLHFQKIPLEGAIRAAFLLKLLDVRIILRVTHIYRKWLILYGNLADIFKNMHFLCPTIYRLPELASWRCS